MQADYRSVLLPRQKKKTKISTRDMKLSCYNMKLHHTDPFFLFLA